jgi:hypothetical protein
MEGFRDKGGRHAYAGGVCVGVCGVVGGGGC